MESGEREIDMEQSYEAGIMRLKYKKYRHPKFPNEELTFEICIDVEKLGKYIENPHFKHPHTRPIPTAETDVRANVWLGKEDESFRCGEAPK